MSLVETKKQPLAINEQLVRFFDTFGFVKLNGYLLEEIQAIGLEFDRLMTKRYGEIESNRHYLYPQFADNSTMLMELVDSSKIKQLAAALCGDNYAYKGSDGNIFVSGSPWHRDYLSRVKSIKMLIYLEHNDVDSGCINLLPGSQFVNDVYSAYLTNSLTWPEPPVLGGFDEKECLPVGNNPVIPGLNRLIPYVPIETSPGDVIVFNHNLVHCANIPIPIKPRRLFGLHFCADLRKEMPCHDSERYMEELLELSRLEMKQFDLKRFYGPAVYKIQTPSMLRHTELLRSLTSDDQQRDVFNGCYETMASGLLDFCNRHKTNTHLNHRYLN
jgi:hypothetical protein